MKRYLILHSLLLALFAGYSQAADMNCNDNWEDDSSVNYQECADDQMPANEKAQTELTSVFDINSPASLNNSREVLCGQCHLYSAPMGQSSGLTVPSEQNELAAFGSF